MHVKTHTKLKIQQEFVCKICDKRFSHKKTLNVHTDTLHTKKRVAFPGGFRFIENPEKLKKTLTDYPCDQCEYKSQLKGNLKKHRDNVYYPCKQCQ